MAKKIMALGLMLIMVFSLAACGNNASLEKQIGDLQKQIEEQDKRIDGLETENKTLSDTTSGLEGSNKTLSDKVKELEGDNKTLSDKVKELEGDNKTLSDKVKELEEQNKALSDKNKELEDELRKYSPTALLFLIDCSDGMEFANDKGDTMLNAAKQSAIRFLDTLAEDDYVGVVSYSGAGESEIGFTPLSQKSQIIGAINGISIRPVGGEILGLTAPYASAIDFANQTLSECPYIANNHIMFVTNGETSDPAYGNNGYNAAIDKCVASGTALSAIFIQSSYFGSEETCIAIAKRGGGKAYDADLTEMLSMALIIAIDRSSSMSFSDYSGTTLLDRAKAAAKLVLSSLSNRDYVGIISLSDYSRMEIGLSPLSLKSKIISAIDGITPLGSTYYTPAIEMAYDELSRCPYEADLKHIMLITDSTPNDDADGTDGYNVEIDKCAAKNITLSVFSLEFQDQIMLDMAERGGGAAYKVDIPAFLYDIMATDLYFIKSKATLAL